MSAQYCRWCGEEDHIEKQCKIKQKRILPLIPGRREKVTGIILNNYLIEKKKTPMHIKHDIFIAWSCQAFLSNLPKLGTFKWADLDD